ncbi:MAG: UDP-3-O-(3-hydroxymyristoyl)glucosamine N-acyltransferase [Legionellaceae bacterium]|nr:UDP-3-O-(3-hydroxymyristoyl)glucosamine N-acyltransferase [Legionellaceae bacterium]
MTLLHDPISFTLLDLEHISGASLLQKEAGAQKIYGITSLTQATPTDLTVLHNKKYLPAFKNSQAGVCIIFPGYENDAPKDMKLLVHKNPYKAYTLILQAFYPEVPLKSYRSPSAYISKTAVLGEDCVIEHGAYIGEQVKIGLRCKIGVNTYIGDNVQLGDDCIIENNVSVSATIAGNKLHVHPGARIGQDGFGFASDADGHYKIPHIGQVIIGNDVSVGANSCIDRGSLENTVIEDSCRIDNLVQIAHNVRIGKGSIIVAQAGIAGSTELGKFVILAAKGGVSGHLKIGDGAAISGGSAVMTDVAPGIKMGGYPAVEFKSWVRQAVLLKKMVKPKNK